LKTDLLIFLSFSNLKSKKKRKRNFKV